MKHRFCQHFAISKAGPVDRATQAWDGRCPLTSTPFAYWGVAVDMANGAPKGQAAAVVLKGRMMPTTTK